MKKSQDKNSTQVSLKNQYNQTVLFSINSISSNNQIYLSQSLNQKQRNSLVQSSCDLKNEKEEALSDLLQLIQTLQNKQESSLMGITKKMEAIRKHYLSQKCKLDHQLKYVTLLLTQKKEQIMRCLDAELDEFERYCSELDLFFKQFNMNLESMKDDILYNKQDIIEKLDKGSFDQVLESLNQQIQQNQAAKDNFQSQQLQISSILEWSLESQSNIKYLTDKCFAIHTDQRALYSSIHLSPSPSTAYSSPPMLKMIEKSCAIRDVESIEISKVDTNKHNQNSAFFISFDQEQRFRNENMEDSSYNAQNRRQKESYLFDSNVKDSCELDFFNEMNQE